MSKMSCHMEVNEVKEYFKFKQAYQIALQKVCTNLYPHKQYMRGVFFSHIFAKNCYNSLVCLNLNLGVFEYGFLALFPSKWGSFTVLQAHLSPFLVPPKYHAYGQ